MHNEPHSIKHYQIYQGIRRNGQKRGGREGEGGRERGRERNRSTEDPDLIVIKNRLIIFSDINTLSVISVCN